ncbi:hypothetical protein MCEKH45_01090 [Methylophilaceae bacterium]
MAAKKTLFTTEEEEVLKEKMAESFKKQQLFSSNCWFLFLQILVGIGIFAMGLGWLDNPTEPIHNTASTIFGFIYTSICVFFWGYAIGHHETLYERIKVELSWNK